MIRWLALVPLLVAAPLVFAQDGALWGPRPVELRPFGVVEIGLPCVAGQDAQALIIGNGRSAIGLYVFDPKGNCVGLDDEPSRVLDDRIVAWTPAVSGPFAMQFRNLGVSFNAAEAAAK